jgi:hypothetical protein
MFSVTVVFCSLWRYASRYQATRFPPHRCPQGNWSEPKAGYSSESFPLGVGEVHRPDWEKFSPYEHRYFDEFFPTLFERTLVIDRLALTARKDRKRGQV